MKDERNTRSDEILRELRETSAEELSTRFEKLCGDDDDLRSRVHDSLATEGFFIDGLDDEVSTREGRLRGVVSEGDDLTSIGPYDLVRPLGQGGMGLVYEAVQRAPNRRVALKVIRPGATSAAALRRFEIETELLGRLLHPGIARIYDAGTATIHGQPQPYFAMELIDGLRLRDFVEQHDLSNRDILELVAKVADAVAHAHQKGVIHRDLKPSNILVEPSGQPKVLDFGLARALGTERDDRTMQTLHGQIVGTLTYMSPEQAAGDTKAVDTRTDIYSLGALAYELLTGQLPFDIEARPVQVAIDVILNQEPRPITRLDPSLAGDVSTIIGKALAKEKERRYATASGFAADIRRHLNDEPIAARPATPLYYLGKFARRNRALVASAVVLVIGLIAAVAIISRHAIRLSEAEAETTKALVVAREALVESERAREAEAEQRRRAEREAQVHRGIHEYVTTMLGITDVNSGGGRNMTVRDWLDAMATEVAKDVSRDEDVQAHLHFLVGEIYIGLSEYGRARRHLEAALELGRDAESPDLGLIGDASSKLGVIHRLRREFPEARRLTLESQRCHEAVGNRGAAVGARVDYIEIRILEGDTEGVAAELDEIIRGLQDGGGSPHTLTVALGTRFNLALRDRDYEAALRTAQERIELLQAIAPGDPRLGTAFNDAGTALIGLGRFDEAVGLLRRSISVYEKTLNDEHSALGASYFNLGRCLQLLQRFDDALDASREADRILRASLGGSHDRTLQVGVVMAEIHAARNELEKAREIYVDMLRRQALAPPATLTFLPGHTRIRLAEIHLDLEDADAALAVARRAAEDLTAPGERLWRLDAKVLVARALHQMDPSEESLAAFDEVIAAFEAIHGAKPSHDVNNARVQRIGALLEMERHEQAVTELETAIEDTRILTGPESPKSVQLLGFMIDSLEKLGRTDDAAKFEKLLEAAKD